MISAASAQQAVGVIQQRIENTFDLVIGNSADLAIPLTRRALARRSAEDAMIIEPLPYRDAAAEEPEITSSTAVSEDVTAEERSTDGAPLTDIARLPRPRPDLAEGDAEDGEPDAGEAPLDLVAGAPAPPFPESRPVEAPKQVAAAEPRQEPAAPAKDAAILPAATGSSAPELVARSSCLPLDKVVDKDGDFKRNAEILAAPGFCVTEDSFKERRRPWTLQTVRTNRPGPLWAVMHDDEDMSFDGAVEALRTYGGTLVAVDTGGKRNQDGIDPNRNFSAEGIGCAKLGTDAAPRYTAFFRALMTDEPIIALHNNSEGNIPTGGLGHVSMKNVPKDMQAVPAADPESPLAGDHSIVLLTSATPISATVEARAKALAAKGINAVIEKVGKGDCSLSNYAILTGHPDYLNITVDHGERDKQRKIIEVIMSGRNDAVATQ